MPMQITLAELILRLREMAAAAAAMQLIFSSPKKGGELTWRKVTVRNYQAQGDLRWYAAFWDGRQEHHRNLTEDEFFLAAWWQPLLEHFKQLQIRTSEADYHLFSNRDGSLRLLKKPPSRIVELGGHDRQKAYLLPEGEAVPFLVALGVMTASGKVVKARYDKFRQINRYLEFVEDVLDVLPAEDVLQIIDFGCGRSYLTFALHWLLTVKHQRRVDIIGLDLKEDVIADCAALAAKLGLQGLRFAVGNIADWQTEQRIDMVVSLHACDTATDAALAQALRWQSRIILAAPCCQHELAPQLQNDAQQGLLRYGILRERLGAMLTDGLRAAALDSLGWRCQILEFIDLEHTPKNLLLRAIRDDKLDTAAARQRYRQLKAAWGIDTFALEGFLDTGLRDALRSE